MGCLEWWGIRTGRVELEPCRMVPCMVRVCRDNVQFRLNGLVQNGQINIPFPISLWASSRWRRMVRWSFFIQMPHSLQ